MGTNVQAWSEKDGKVKRTKIGKPVKAFTAIIKKCELAMNLSHASASVDDGNGNKITVFVWVSGDWKVEYKGKEYIIPLNENVQALIDWINSKEKK